MATKTSRNTKKVTATGRPRRVARKAYRIASTAGRRVAVGPSGRTPGGVSVLEIRHGLHLGRRLFSRITGFSERAIADWEGSKPLSGPSLLKMREIARLRAALNTIMREEFIGAWLDTPNPAFQGLKPVEVIERGEIDRIWRMVYEVGSGEPT